MVIGFNLNFEFYRSNSASENEIEIRKKENLMSLKNGLEHSMRMNKSKKKKREILILVLFQK